MFNELSRKQRRGASSLIAKELVSKGLEVLGSPNIGFEKNASGAPICLSEGFFCSYAHSHEFIIACVANIRVGIDIEFHKSKRNWQGIAAVLWPEQKLDMMEFYRRWCITEAWSKFTYIGLNAASWKIQIEESTIYSKDSPVTEYCVWQNEEYTVAVVCPPIPLADKQNVISAIEAKIIASLGAKQEIN